MPTAAQSRETNTHTHTHRRYEYEPCGEISKTANRKTPGDTPKHDENAESHRMRNRKRRRISTNEEQKTEISGEGRMRNNKRKNLSG